MGTKSLAMKGTIKWANNLFVKDEMYDNYHVNFYPDEESLEKFKESGSRISIREDKETGEPFMIFRRPHEHHIAAFGGPPKVFHDDGRTLWSADDPLIGNGTGASINLSIYDTKMGPGTRLEAVRVDNLLEYIPPNANAEGEGDGEAPTREYAFD